MEVAVDSEPTTTTKNCVHDSDKMTAKIQKVTLKGLQSELFALRIELQTVKDDLKKVMVELIDVKERKEDTTSDGAVRIGEMVGKQIKICKICEKTFKLKKDLLLHVKNEHPREIKCKTCDDIFTKSSDLELHIKQTHNPETIFSCEDCDKTFIFKFRLRKHQESHRSKDTKNCHYFNNKKHCPFEEIGCMFAHVLSEFCFFDKKCKNELCSFQHEYLYKEREIEYRQRFDKLKPAEQNEAKMVLCDKLCNPSLGYHMCTPKDYEKYVGCDVFNIAEEVDNNGEKTEWFPCDMCDKEFQSYEELNTHFKSLHKPFDIMGCSESECKETFKSVDVLVKHIGVSHIDIVRQRL